MSSRIAWHESLVGRLEAKIEKMPDHEIISLLGMNQDEMPYRNEAMTAEMVRSELRARIRQHKKNAMGKKLLRILLAQLEKGDAK